MAVNTNSITITSNTLDSASFANPVVGTTTDTTGTKAISTAYIKNKINSYATLTGTQTISSLIGNTVNGAVVKSGTLSVCSTASLALNNATSLVLNTVPQIFSATIPYAIFTSNTSGQIMNNVLFGSGTLITQSTTINFSPAFSAVPQCVLVCAVNTTFTNANPLRVSAYTASSFTVNSPLGNTGFNWIAFGQ